MKIGIPKEVKNNEYRVAVTPAGVFSLTRLGHTVLLENSAGEGSGFADVDYAAAGAVLLREAAEVYAGADLIVKVKEPLEQEYGYLREGQALFTFLHLAPNPALTQALLKKRITGIAYETVGLPGGAHPLLSPMSEVAGRMSIQVGANLLQKYSGGEGILLGGVPGVRPAEVLIIGGGVVGTNAAKMATGLGARVTVMDLSKERLNYLDDIFSGRVTTLLYSEYSAAEMVRMADLLIGAVLVTGARAPKTISEEMVKSMKKGAVIVDVAIDQGGSVATIDRVTTHDNPSYEKHGVIHYSVANMPGAVPRTSTLALTGVTLPYIVQLAEKGVVRALRDDGAFLSGLNTHDGFVTSQPVAGCFGLDYVPAEKCLAGYGRTA